MSTGMEEFIESPMMLLQCGIALAVPAVLAAVVNLGCGKKRDQPIRPGGAKKDLSKSKPGVASSSKSAKAGSKSKRSTKSAASAKSGKKDSSIKDGKSKRSSKSIDKSGKSGKDKSGKKLSKSSKGSSKSKKSKRDVVQQKTGPPSSDAAKQPPSTRTALAIDAEKRSAKQAGTLAAAALAHENSAKSAATQLSSSQRSSQPVSGGLFLDGNANVVGTTALVAVNAGDTTRDLKMEPAELRWASAGGMQKISLMNQSTERQAVKVKCSDNNVYRVNPVYAIVEPGQTLNVDVMRQNGSNKVDKIVFVTTKAGLEENPKNLFKPGTQSSMMVLPLLATTTTNAASAINQQQPAALEVAV